MTDADNGVQTVVAAFADAWNRHDMAGFGELFAEDAELVNVVGLWWKGRDEIRKAHEYSGNSGLACGNRHRKSQSRGRPGSSQGTPERTVNHC